MYVKTCLELDPSDKDKVYQCIKYWVILVERIDFDTINSLDIDMLWGEIMNLK